MRLNGAAHANVCPSGLALNVCVCVCVKSSDTLLVLLHREKCLLSLTPFGCLAPLKPPLPPCLSVSAEVASHAARAPGLQGLPTPAAEPKLFATDTSPPSPALPARQASALLSPILWRSQPLLPLQTDSDTGDRQLLSAAVSRRGIDSLLPLPLQRSHSPLVPLLQPCTFFIMAQVDR